MGRRAGQLLDQQKKRRVLITQCMNHSAGITVIEILITLAVLSIVIALGVPSITDWVRRMEVRSSAESLRAAIQRARSEAIARNTRIRISLSNSTGNPGWDVTCVYKNTNCPAILLTHATERNNLVRWGAATMSNSSNLTKAIRPGTTLPGTIDFSPLGDAPHITSGKDIARIDVLHSASTDDIRFVIRIDGAGKIRMCDPSRYSTHPEACRS